MMQSLLNSLQDFHFIRPLWLWGLAALLLIWLLIANLRRNTQWETFIDQKKLEALRVTGGRYSDSWRWLLIAGWILGCLAAAGPTWKQIPTPTVRDQAAMVVLLDLSPSMLAQDLTPDRLTRAKFKLIDILRARSDGLTALIAYAGDPHTVSPLTDDVSTIEALLPALHPGIMPLQGSNAESAIELAMALLRDAGAAKGDILLMTDGVEREAQRYIRDNLDANFRLSILGIGSTEAVPIPQLQGGFIRDNSGNMVLTRLNRDELQILAGVSRGRYVELQPDDSDIEYLLGNDFDRGQQETEERTQLYDIWEDMGYWLVLVLLPFVAWNFRKGALFALPLFALPLLFLLPQDSQAQSQTLSWDDLWLTKDQQAARLLEQDQATEAAETFKDKDWQATANYRAGNFAEAADSFSRRDNASSFYNEGNALAFAQDFEGAIAAYDKALSINPELEDAAYNKAVIEQLMQQQEQQQQQNQGDQENSDEQNQQQSESDQSQQSESGESQQGDSQQDSQANQSEQNESMDSESEQAQSEESQSQQDQAQNSEQASEQQEEQQPQDTQNAGEESQQDSAEQQAQMQAMMAEPTPEQLQDSSEQWLRAIPDDPSGLLRRKFDYETQQRRAERRYMLQLPGNENEQRY